VIVAIIERKEAFEIDSPEWLFCIRKLKALRYSREAAGGIIDQHDEQWGCSCRPN
jgi:hypothetical protein